jgi:hypothetical protein
VELVNGKYQFEGGIDPLELCKEYGSPLYVYDASITSRIELKSKVDIMFNF